MSERILLAIAGALIAVLLGLAFLWHPEPAEKPVPLMPLPPGGDFSLQSADGPVSLADFRGKVAVLYFGYTFCPDICPTSLNLIAEGLRQLTPDERSRVVALFVSVDPERDKPAQLKQYVQFFGPEFVGLTGSPEALAEVARRYGVIYARQKSGTENPMAYSVDHTSETYVIAANGLLSDRLAHGTAPEKLAAAIRKSLTQP